jgi:hypothetical protein
VDVVLTGEAGDAIFLANISSFAICVHLDYRYFVFSMSERISELFVDGCKRLFDRHGKA